MKKMNNDFIIGGWSQNLTAVAPESFSYAMYGMITNFPALTSGTVSAPGWRPKEEMAPQHASCNVLWTYGGAGGEPKGTPSDQTEMDAIIEATIRNNWAGVDFDNESAMNITNIAKTTLELKKQKKESSYTFLAGYDYNHSPQGAADVKSIVENGAADRFILMCYGDSMWSMDDIRNNVGQAIEKTIAQGADLKKIILALTCNGLTEENLDYFLDLVIKYEIGGLFIWEYPNLEAKYLNRICTKLQINKLVGSH